MEHRKVAALGTSDALAPLMIQTPPVIHTKRCSILDGKMETMLVNAYIHDALMRFLMISPNARVTIRQVFALQTKYRDTDQETINQLLRHQSEGRDKKADADTGIATFCNLCKNAPEKAPHTHKAPACPRLSSPKIPTVKFKETARITHRYRLEPEVPSQDCLNYQSSS